jgi:calcineurin-like phosphoesterase family protein
MSNKFFTSDTHFGHGNIIRYAGRPYLNEGDLTPDGKDWTSKFHSRSAARRMDEDLITRWNSVVNPNDDVYHLGDFSFNSAFDYLRKLNFNNLYFIWGNHDSHMDIVYRNLDFYSDLRKRIHFLGDMAEVYIEGKMIILNHYAMRVWKASHKASWHLYGHSHGSLPDDPTSLSFDVGIDCHDLKPITFGQVSEIMAKKNFVPIDHHGARPHENGGVGLSQKDYTYAARKAQYEALKKEFENEKS